MKCNNCGAEFKANELVCPFCGSPNVIGQEWKSEEFAADQKKEQTRKYVIRSMPLYILNRVLNTIIGVGIGLAVVSIIILFVAYYAEEKMDEYSFKKATVDEAESLYQAKDFMALDQYLTDHDVYYQDKEDLYDKYTDAVILYNGWTYLKEDMLRYYDASVEKIERQMDYGPVYNAFEGCCELLSKDTYYYRIECSENESQYEEYAEIAEAFLIGELLITEDELELIKCGEVNYNNRLEWVQKIYDRKGWKVNENN